MTNNKTTRPRPLSPTQKAALLYFADPTRYPYPKNGGIATTRRLRELGLLDFSGEHGAQVITIEGRRLAACFA